MGCVYSVVYMCDLRVSAARELPRCVEIHVVPAVLRTLDLRRRPIVLDARSRGIERDLERYARRLDVRIALQRRQAQRECRSATDTSSERSLPASSVPSSDLPGARPGNRRSRDLP